MPYCILTDWVFPGPQGKKPTMHKWLISVHIMAKTPTQSQLNGLNNKLGL